MNNALSSTHARTHNGIKRNTIAKLGKKLYNRRNEISTGGILHHDSVIA